MKAIILSIRIVATVVSITQNELPRKQTPAGPKVYGDRYLALLGAWFSHARTVPNSGEHVGPTSLPAQSNIYSDHNHIARIQNSFQEVSADDLHPLVNLTTNTPF